MDVILRSDVGRLGKVGKIVKVKDGYARNFLIPQGLAVPVTQANIKQMERERQLLEQRSQKLRKESEELAGRLAALSVTMPALIKEGTEEELYGSITAHDLAAALEEEGFKIEKSAILLAEPVRKLGIYEIPVRLHPEVTVKVKVWVVKQ